MEYSFILKDLAVSPEDSNALIEHLCNLLKSQSTVGEIIGQKSQVHSTAEVEKNQKSELESKDERIAELERSVAMGKASIASYEEELKGKYARIVELNAELKVLKSNTFDASSPYSSYIDRICTSLREENTRLSAALFKCRRNKNGMDDFMNTWKEAAENRIKELKRENDDFKKELKEADSKIEALLEENSRLNSVGYDCKKDISRLSADFQEKEEELAKCNDSHKLLASELDRQAVELRDKDIELKVSQDANSFLRNKVAEMDAQIKEKESQIQGQANKIACLEGDIVSRDLRIEGFIEQLRYKAVAYYF